MKKVFLSTLLMLTVLMTSAQNRQEVHVLSINDPHAALEQFPRLGYVADSLRALYPNLLILSAGDNRSGDPINDMFEIPAYPMVALMNQVGFHATVVGNHEFDSNQYGLARLIDLGTFSTLCANMEPDPKFKMHIKPYQIFDCGGISVGVLGITALGFIFQTDSDGQTDPAEFEAFWKARAEGGFDAVIGTRPERGDGKSRAFVEKVVCMLLGMYFGIKVTDANAPFRLMKSEVVARYLNRFDKHYNLPNIMLTTFFVYYKEKVCFKEISFKQRSAGKASLNIPKITKIGLHALSDFRRFKKGL